MQHVTKKLQMDAMLQEEGRKEKKEKNEEEKSVTLGFAFKGTLQG